MCIPECETTRTEELPLLGILHIHYVPSISDTLLARNDQLGVNSEAWHTFLFVYRRVSATVSLLKRRRAIKMRQRHRDQVGVREGRHPPHLDVYIPTT